MSFIGDKQFQQ